MQTATIPPARLLLRDIIPNARGMTIPRPVNEEIARLLSLESMHETNLKRT